MRITQDHNTESPTNPDAEGKESDGNECVKGAATKNEERSVGARFGQLFDGFASFFRGMLGMKMVFVNF